ncbi:4'-phosphopantetheinyl transferase family protein [Olivibacter sitiensis]|uniref:4'-phosphopantetheinyl transferase family protein n=1 Tax=Olivibacter sitiensis TaxID=376470 RepID=UPI000413D4AB|nr:4'-phosphopantetheinyl transferase superfamily protein [Olivibacter sitiensis]
MGNSIFAMPLVYEKNIDTHTRFAIWRIEENADELLAKLQLKQDELAFLKKLNKGKRTLNWLGTRALLRTMLNTTGYIECPSDANGKPFLSNFSEKISLSHSFDYAAVMMSDKYDVGIDMELVKPKIDIIARKFLSSIELDHIAEGENRIDMLTACWCAKEAVYKLQGNKGVSFKDNMLVEPFQFNPQGGHLFTRLSGSKMDGRYKVYYERFGDYMIGYVDERTF